MPQNIRWAAAVLVTVAAFTVSTWLCGAVVLPSMLKDPAIRWGLASALGGAMAALAASWGHGFATRARREDPPRTPSGGSVQATGERAVAIHGNPAGDISTGDTRIPRTPADPTARREPAPPDASPAPPPAPQPGTVTASGERSIAISGNPGGNLSTGDHPGEGQA
ncbi:hypothetical protein ACIHJG_34010 [Streptomyces sp. NPDC052415]|uniref:hypothetical protein n=1 Tax=Streptomyces sp. NPDC052415 TaxID=3365690 RepID=UPI0037CE4ABE